MEEIDRAYSEFQKLRKSIESLKSSILTEADTRMKVIDPMLIDVLGYSKADISTEPPAGDKFIDYKIAINGLARLIVEAKRDRSSFGLGNRGAARFYKLNGPVFSDEVAKKGISQSIWYCAVKNAELACVTNGHEWIVFRGSRLGDGQDTYEGLACVFDSLKSVDDKFKTFFDLLSFEAVNELRYRAHFQEAEGRTIRSSNFSRAIRNPNSKRPLPMSPLAGDLERVMNSFFQRLTGDQDPSLIADCFVVTDESDIADQKLIRVSEDLIGRIKSIDTTNADKLTEIISRVKTTQHNEFVLLIGTKGAGKTTFVERFFRNVLPSKLAKECVVVRVNLALSKGNAHQVTTWLDQNVLAELEKTLFEGRVPTYDELMGVFFDEYQRWSQGPHQHLYESDKVAFKNRFGEHMEKRREERPHEYIQRLLRDVIKSRKLLPCLVFDNADHFSVDFQERVFQYARSIFETTLCLVLVPITDRTSWQLSSQGMFRSFECESFFLPTPHPSSIIQRRIEFIQKKLKDEERVPGGTGYFIGRGISLSIKNINTFTAALQTIFLKTGNVSEWIGNLANMDIRQCLELAKIVATSPYLEIDDLFKSYVVGSTINIAPRNIKKAIIRGNYDIYPSGIHRFVQNMYCPDDKVQSSPLTGLRILMFLKDVLEQHADDPYVEIEQIIRFFEAMHVDSAITASWLNFLLRNALCLNADPTNVEVDLSQRIQIAPSGAQHLDWALRDFEYALAMAETTPIKEQACFERITELSKNSERNANLRVIASFIEYIVNEDYVFLRVPKHAAYESQEKLTESLLRTKRKIDEIVERSTERRGIDRKYYSSKR